MKKLFLLCMLMCVFGLTRTNAQEYNFDDYVYPFGYRTFISQNSEGKTTSISQFSFASEYFDNYIIEEVYIGMGMMSAKTAYRYHTEDNMVISDVQLRQNAMTGSTKYQDKIVLFAFPEKDKPFKWTETDRGDKYQCTSEYVYINASINQKMSFMQAIKITRDNSYIVGNEKHRIIETSYWTSNCGRIITFVDLDGTKNTSSKLDVLDYVQEISTEEYNTYIKKK